MGVLVIVLIGVAWVALVAIFGAAILAAPVYLALAALRFVRARRAARRISPRERARAEAVLREHYASGMLTLVGLEERLDDVLRARRGLELEHVLDDLPARRPPFDRTALVCAAGGVGLLLAAASLPAKLGGAAAIAVAFLPRAHWVVYALACGAGLLFLAAGALPAVVVAAVAVATALALRDEARA